MRDSWYKKSGKRVFDIVGIIIFAPVWLPLMLFCSAVVFIGLGRPVFFRQQRPGKGGESFKILKFRTMTNDTDEKGDLLTDEKRLPRIGRLLRSMSLDEIPELLNVLKGDMSIVGPRPLLMQYLERYSSYEARRLAVKPGLTGWAQVRGRNAITWQEKFDYDVWYVDHISLGFDVKIIFLTVWQVLTARGINAGGHATMPEFMGSDSSKQE